MRWTVRGSPYRFSLPGEWYSFGEYGDGWWYYGEERYDEGRMIYSSGEGRTDENGIFHIELLEKIEIQVCDIIDRSKRRRQWQSAEARVTQRDHLPMTCQRVKVWHALSEELLGVQIE